MPRGWTFAGYEWWRLCCSGMASEGTPGVLPVAARGVAPCIAREASPRIALDASPGVVPAAVVAGVLCLFWYRLAGLAAMSWYRLAAVFRRRVAVGS